MMKSLPHIQRQFFRSKWLVAGSVVLALLLLAGAIFLIEFQFRNQLRARLINRDGEILQTVLLMQQSANEANDELSGPLDDPQTYFDEILKISRAKGIVAVRLFDPVGKFINAFPAYVTEMDLAAADQAKMAQLKPASHFRPAVPLKEFDLLNEISDSEKTMPLLEINLPLQMKGSRQLIGSAQFLMEGTSLAEAFVELDRQLWWKGAGIFGGCGLLLTGVLIFAFRRVQATHRQLLAANRELTQAAKTTAVGAVTSHLIHGLKNPLSGLQNFVNNQGGQEPSDWQDAAAAAQRMQSLIAEVVRVLKEQEGGEGYELSLSDLADTVAAKMKAGPRLQIRQDVDAILTGRQASLIVLVLENLIENALAATPPNKPVRLDILETSEAIVFEVVDEGPGMPAEMRDSLFKPCRSTKPGGGGIGLAISKQLSSQLGAGLELRKNSSNGCVFSLSVPKTFDAVSPVLEKKTA